MERRRFLGASATVAAVALAGCGNPGEEGGDEEGEEGGDDGGDDIGYALDEPRDGSRSSR